MPYRHDLIRKARSLRTKQTDVERILWNNLRARRLKGYKFKRQFPIGSYILDFYCEDKKLAIELDGSQHMEEKHADYDLRRTDFLRKQGITVLRFWDNEALSETDTILEVILHKLEQ